ncbi:bgnt-1.1, partial [Pristionchus pacificus]
CDLLLSTHLSLHIVYERAPFQDECVNITLPVSTDPCEEVNMKLYKELSETNPSPFGEYPINLMRNVARRGAPSLLHLVADIEMEFSSNFTHYITPLANRIVLPKERRALVVRRFEVESRTDVPRSVDQLKRFYRIKKAFEYHHSIFLTGHRIPGLWHWFEVSEPQMEPQSLPMDYMSSQWEPQVILHADDPMNDESIPTRHKDQQALIYELCRAGYHFEVASHGFNVHRGIRNKTSPFEMAVMLTNRRGRFKALSAYRERMDRMYPDTKNLCGNFSL